MATSGKSRLLFGEFRRRLTRAAFTACVLVCSATIGYGFAPLVSAFAVCFTEECPEQSDETTELREATLRRTQARVARDGLRTVCRMPRQANQFPQAARLMTVTIPRIDAHLLGAGIRIRC